jgi:hypothetical protein
MPSQSDVRAIEQGKVKSKRRFDQRDFDFIAEFVIQEWKRRKSERRDLERHWAEIDRQVSMQPDLEFKKLPNGRLDINKLWMSEVEPPLQAQALEVLTADARQMLFGDSWFRAHAEVTDSYLDRVDFKGLILGDEAEVPSQITQDNADKLVEGFLLHYFRQTDFFTRYDRINAEAFKYGMGVGRGRMQTKNVYLREARGVRKEKQRIPVLVPVSIKNLYLDDPMPSMHSAQVLGPAEIAQDWIKLENLVLAASRGSSDPQDEDGGWMPSAASKLVANKNGFVQVLEMEGDIVIPRKTVRSMVIPGAIVTVALGAAQGDGRASRGLIRLRFRQQPFSSYMLHPYHYEGADGVYPASPLMKGRPVQIMVSQGMNRLIDSAMLKNAPPVGYDRNDMTFAQDGGPRIHPYAQWGTTDAVNDYDAIGGDPSALSQVLALSLDLYSELTGVLPTRIGAEKIANKTAFATNAELQRGAVRTVDYVNQVGEGPLTSWLELAYRMGRDAFKSREKINFYIEDYGGFVEVGKQDLPDASIFRWLGTGGATDKQLSLQARLQSLQIALQMEQANIATGGQPMIVIVTAIRQVLREGTWTDVDAIIRTQEPASGPAPASGVSGVLDGGGGAEIAALQALNGLSSGEV